MYRYKCISIVDRYKSTTLINICQKMCFMFSQAMKRVLSRGMYEYTQQKYTCFWVLSTLLNLLPRIYFPSIFDMSTMLKLVEGVKVYFEAVSSGHF